MNYEQFNQLCESLPATSYVMQWGDSHVWKVAGKVFAIGGWEKLDQPAFTFKTAEGDFLALQDESGFQPAPYMAARGMKWIQIYDSTTLSDDEIEFFIRESHRIVSGSLSKKKQKELGLNQG